MDMYGTWLAAPALAGVLLHAHAAITSETIENYKYKPLYSIGVVLWGICFDRFWLRRRTELAVEWGVHDAKEPKTVRRGFYGEVSTSPVTNRPARYYAAYRRGPFYFLSSVVTVAFLFCGAGVAVACLNLQVRARLSLRVVCALQKRALPSRWQ